MGFRWGSRRGVRRPTARLLGWLGLVWDVSDYLQWRPYALCHWVLADFLYLGGGDSQSTIVFKMDGVD
jgi:hypothetical protein